MNQLKLIFLFMALCLASFSIGQDAKTFMEKAKQKSKERKYKEAVSLSTKAIELEPKQPDYYILRSEYYISAGMTQEGFDDINRAIKVAPTYSKSYWERANFYYLIRESDKSILDYTYAIKYAESDSIRNIYLVNRSSSKLQKRDYTGAIADCEEALKIDSMNVGAINNIAMSLDEVGRDDETLFYLKKVIRIDSMAAYAYMNIGFWLSNHKQYKEALPYFDKSIALEPGEAFPYNNRGYARLMLNDFNGALEDINKSIKLSPTNPYAYRNRGLVYMAQGKKSKACEEWNLALRYEFTKMYGPEVEELLKKNCF